MLFEVLPQPTHRGVPVDWWWALSFKVGTRDLSLVLNFYLHSLPELAVMTDSYCPHMYRLSWKCILLIASIVIPGGSPAHAQFAGGGQGGGNQGNNLGGIAIDAVGVVTPAFVKETTSRLNRKRQEALAAEHLPEDVNVSSPLRKVSLVRLEKMSREFAEQKRHVPVEMQFLAGLQRIDYVFVYPETGDIVIAGPAEGFAPNIIGRVLGTSTGRPPLRLDDLIVALRTVPGASLIGCSIDPTQEGLVRFNDYVKRNSFATTVAVIQQRFREMAQAMGNQDVSVFGVPANSHFATVLVEADYRMKLMSVGLERPKIPKWKSHLELVGSGGNTLQRWWFTPRYGAFRQSEDGNAFQFSGPRVQLMSQSEQVSASGKRSAAAMQAQSIEKFARQFTECYEDVAEVSPVFAELQNIIDLAILAALFEKEQLPQRVGWSMSLFLDKDQAPLATGNSPSKVASVCNYRKAGSSIVGLVGGGVTISPNQLLRDVSFDRQGNRELESRVRGSAPPAGVKTWWWD
mgnify:FL=1